MNNEEHMFSAPRTSCEAAKGRFMVSVPCGHTNFLDSSFCIHCLWPLSSKILNKNHLNLIQNLSEASNNLEEVISCPISRDVLDECIILSCGHIFDEVSFLKSLEYSDRCPLCRTPVNTKQAFVHPYVYTSEIKQIIMRVFDEDAYLLNEEHMDVHEYFKFFHIHSIRSKVVYKLFNGNKPAFEMLKELSWKHIFKLAYACGNQMNYLFELITYINTLEINKYEAVYIHQKIQSLISSGFINYKNSFFYVSLFLRIFCGNIDLSHLFASDFSSYLQTNFGLMFGREYVKSHGLLENKRRISEKIIRDVLNINSQKLVSGVTMFVHHVLQTEKIDLLIFELDLKICHYNESFREFLCELIIFRVETYLDIFILRGFLDIILKPSTSNVEHFVLKMIKNKIPLEYIRKVLKCVPKTEEIYRQCLHEIYKQYLKCSETISLNWVFTFCRYFYRYTDTFSEKECRIMVEIFKKDENNTKLIFVDMWKNIKNKLHKNYKNLINLDQNAVPPECYPCMMQMEI